jgi:hypothetical protein
MSSMSSVSSVSSVASQTETASINDSILSSTDSTSSSSEIEDIAETVSDNQDDAQTEVQTIAETIREVYVISDEDAREHEDAVELVNWSTFDEWKQPWHVVKLWEGSVYDDLTLWGSIPLQNDKLRKVYES